jgi:hypothetical protein
MHTEIEKHRKNLTALAPTQRAVHDRQRSWSGGCRSKRAPRSLRVAPCATFWQSAVDFRSTPIIGRTRCRPPVRKSAKSRLMHCSKTTYPIASLVLREPSSI